MTTNDRIWAPAHQAQEIQARELYDSVWRNNIQRRLNHLLQTAVRIPFDNQSRFILFSDTHRSDGRSTDLFVQNRPLFLQALHHYYQAGFTYMEVGDGDDLWQTPRFEVIRQAHSAVFDLLHRFHQQNRLHIILGNHDMPHGSPPASKDGLPLREGVVLHHIPSGQEILVAHGHQGDFSDSRFTFFSRLAVRHIWKYWQQMGVRDEKTAVSGNLNRLVQQIYHWSRSNGVQLEKKLSQWVQKNRQIFICGHTHIPRFTTQPFTPYFNTGSCLNPGYLTGLEIQNGEITPVRWQVNGSIYRETTATPKKLSLWM